MLLLFWKNELPQNIDGGDIIEHTEWLIWILNREHLYAHKMMLVERQKPCPLFSIWGDIFGKLVPELLRRRVPLEFIGA